MKGATVGRERTLLWDEDSVDLHSPSHAFIRRHLLGAAARGFALATSVMLPAWLVEEAEAGNHPVRGVQQRKEQRRAKARHQKHRDRHRRHNHGDQQENRAPGAVIDGIRWRFYTEAGAFDVELWDNDGWGWSRRDSQRVENEHFVELRTKVLRGALMDQWSLLL